MPLSKRRRFSKRAAAMLVAMSSAVERGATIDTPAPPTGACAYAGSERARAWTDDSGIRSPAGKARWRSLGGGPLSHRTALLRLKYRADQPVIQAAGTW